MYLVVFSAPGHNLHIYDIAEKNAPNNKNGFAIIS